MSNHCVFRIESVPIRRNQKDRAKALMEHCKRKHDQFHVDKTKKNRNVHIGALADDRDFMAEFEARQEKGFIQANTQEYMAEIIYSASHEFFFDEAGNLKKEDTKKWIEATLDYVNEEFGEDFLGASLHMDEKTPHFHVFITPTAENRNKTKKVNHYSKKFKDRRNELAKWKKEGTLSEKSKLGQMQTRYHQHLVKAGLKLERGKRNSQRKHIEPKEFRKEQKKIIEAIENKEIYTQKAFLGLFEDTDATVAYMQQHVAEKDIEYKQLKEENERLQYALDTHKNESKNVFDMVNKEKQELAQVKQELLDTKKKVSFLEKILEVFEKFKPGDVDKAKKYLLDQEAKKRAEEAKKRDEALKQEAKKELEDKQKELDNKAKKEAQDEAPAPHSPRI